LDKIYCQPLIGETTPKIVQEHDNNPHCMATLNILKDIDCVNFVRVKKKDHVDHILLSKSGSLSGGVIRA
jgi:hypothetical protein